MSDFDSNWQISGTPDPATPDPQPAQQPQPPVNALPQQNQVINQQQIPVQNSQPVMPQNQQPQAMPQYQQPVMPQYQQPQAMPQYQQPAMPQFQQPQAMPQYQPHAVPVQVQSPVAGQYPQQPQPRPNQPLYCQPQYQFPGSRPNSAPADYSRIPQPAFRDDARNTAIRNANLAECNKMISHFGQKSDVFEKYETCREQIEKKSKVRVGTITWGIIFAYVGLILSFMTMTTRNKNVKLGYTIASIAVVLIGAGLIVLYFLLKRKNNKIIKEAYEQMSEMSEQLTILYNGYSNCVLPAEFTDPRILFRIKTSLTYGYTVTIAAALTSLLVGYSGAAAVSNAKKKFQEKSNSIVGKELFFDAAGFLNIK